MSFDKRIYIVETAMQDSPAQLPDTLDGYRLILFLGRGGFGEVWLCRSEAMGDYRALKWIPATNADRLEKEYESLIHYRRAAAALRSPALLAIEHVGRTDDGLYYIMPLADGVTNTDPAEPGWIPLSLAEKLRRQAEAPGWFSSSEVIDLMIPVLEGLKVLSEAGLVHRDVKPDNILFFHGKPCLGDISLLGEDLETITRRGTLGYAAPSWYLGGHPDMYGAAATLYSLLTGNPPDCMGKSSFLWPPQGESSLSGAEQSEWKRVHRVIRRATEEKVSERFVDFRAMQAAIPRQSETQAPPPLPTGKKRLSALRFAIFLLAVIAAIGTSIFIASRPKADVPINTTPASNQAPSSARDTPANSTDTSGVQEVAYIDAATAYNSLSWLPNDYDKLGVSFDENSLFQDTMGMIQPHAFAGELFDPREAVRELDQCLSAIEKLREVPNVMLARLLLLQAAGDLEAVNEGMNNPILWSPGKDSLGYRVKLLCRLHAANRAEDLLGKVLESQTSDERDRSEMLTLRTEVRIHLGKFEEARSDASQALAAVAHDAALKAGAELKLRRLEDEYPPYAAYLKSQE